MTAHAAFVHVACPCCHKRTGEISVRLRELGSIPRTVEIVTHHVHPVDVRLHAFEVEALHVVWGPSCQRNETGGLGV